MRIRFQDIDPQLAGEIRALEASRSKDTSTSLANPLSSSFKEILQTQSSALSGMMVVCSLFGMLVLFVSMGLVVRYGDARGENPPWWLYLLSFLPAFLAVNLSSTMLGRIVTRRFETRLICTGLHRIAATRIEKQYASAVVTLVTTDTAYIGGKEAAYGILRQLNVLMETGHLVDRSLRDIRAAQGPKPIEELESEVRVLRVRAAEATDSQAGETFRQSAEIAASRVESIRAISGLTERLSAQEEIICQTLLSVESALKRIRIAPSAGAGITRVSEIGTTITGINAQARAIEQAVQEVMSLQAR